MKHLPSLKKQIGLTLMELVASLTIAAIIVIGVLSLYKGANKANDSLRTTNEVIAIRNTLLGLVGSSNFGDATTTYGSGLNATGRLPTSISFSSPNTLTGAGGTTYTVTGVSATTPSQFLITMTNHDSGNCIPLLTALDSTWVSAGGNATPVTPTQAQTTCLTTSVAIIGKK